MKDIFKTIAYRIALIVNIVNHVLNCFVFIVVTWFAFEPGYEAMKHPFLVTLGFQFLLAEGILSYYSANAWSSVYSTGARRHLHWILQVAGSAIALAGAFLMIANVNKEGGTHFDSTHGKLGLASIIFLFLNLLTGIVAFFSIQFRNLMRPIVLKSLHTCLGITGFTLGMVTLYYGIMKLQRRLDYSFVVMLSVFSLVSLVLTMIGPLKSLIRNLTSMRSDLK